MYTIIRWISVVIEMNLLIINWLMSGDYYRNLRLFRCSHRIFWNPIVRYRSQLCAPVLVTTKGSKHYISMSLYTHMYLIGKWNIACFSVVLLPWVITFELFCYTTLYLLFLNRTKISVYLKIVVMDSTPIHNGCAASRIIWLPYP